MLHSVTRQTYLPATSNLTSTSPRYRDELAISHCRSRRRVQFWRTTVGSLALGLVLGCGAIACAQDAPPAVLPPVVHVAPLQVPPMPTGQRPPADLDDILSAIRVGQQIQAVNEQMQMVYQVEILRTLQQIEAQLTTLARQQAQDAAARIAQPGLDTESRD